MNPTTAPHSRRLVRLVLSAVALAAATLTWTAPAGAAPLAPAPGTQSGTPAGYGIGYNNVVGTVGIFSHLMNINGTKVYVYCLLQPLTYGPTGTYHATYDTASGVSNVAVATDIAANSSKIGTPLTTPAMEAVAVQIAIWSATTGYNIYQVQNSSITQRASQLLTTAVALAQQPLGAVLHVTRNSNYTSTTVHLKLTDTEGMPLAGQRLVVLDGARHAYVTNTAGRVTLAVRGRHVVKVVWTGTLAAGTVMMLPSPTAQPLVTAAAAPITRTLAFYVAPNVRRVTPTTVRYVAPTTVRRVTPTTVRRVTPTTVRRTVTTTTAPRATTTTVHHVTTTTVRHAVATTSTTLKVATTTTTLAIITTGSHFKDWWWLLIVAFLALLVVLGRRMFERS